MKKKFVCMAILLCLVFTMAVPAGAAPQVIQTMETVTTEYGDIEVETTIVVYSDFRSSSKRAEATRTYKQGGKVIAEVTFSANFGYDGKTAWVISASGSHTTYDGWSYGGERITKSGGTATLTATVSKLEEYPISVNISITCTPSGSIS